MKFYYDKEGKLIWAAPGAVYFNLEQVEWLLPQLKSLREGFYLPEPSSGYTDCFSIQHSHRAPFEKAVLIAAEIDIRLAHTGLDRYLVEDKHCRGLSESEIAKSLTMSELEVYKRIRSAVSYIASGRIPRWIDTEKRKGILYRDWVRNRRRQWFKPKVPHLL